MLDVRQLFLFRYGKKRNTALTPQAIITEPSAHSHSILETVS
jgi:hypothetical protein